MELMKRDFLTVTDDGDDICMTLDTAHKTVQEIGRKMAESYFRSMSNKEYAAFGVKNCAILTYEWDE
ncbi:MAG: hypothetical protein IKG19_06790 [Lachnospiraceae bacterium]|nr:hypothetical protein [Lachnospiraceae bacterium]